MEHQLSPTQPPGYDNRQIQLVKIQAFKFIKYNYELIFAYYMNKSFLQNDLKKKKLEAVKNIIYNIFKMKLKATVIDFQLINLFFFSY